mmetsp:Transcript_14326/g.36553  ORF Transcript_14326/g.36553 Transcript_14326/m.36553 type:complete len:147 (-) Transcript_14326:625-1065(-)
MRNSVAVRDPQEYIDKTAERYKKLNHVSPREPPRMFVLSALLEFLRKELLWDQRAFVPLRKAIDYVRMVAEECDDGSAYMRMILSLRRGVWLGRVNAALARVSLFFTLRFESGVLVIAKARVKRRRVLTALQRGMLEMLSKERHNY